MITLEIVTIRNRLTIITLSEFITLVFSDFYAKILNFEPENGLQMKFVVFELKNMIQKRSKGQSQKRSGQNLNQVLNNIERNY